MFNQYILIEESNRREFRKYRQQRWSTETHILMYEVRHAHRFLTITNVYVSI